METVLLILLLVVQSSPITAPASSQAASQASPNPQTCPLTITNISWRPPFCVLQNCEHSGAFSIDVKNTGLVPIKTVYWDFYLVDDVRQQVYDRFRFVTDDKTVSPNNSKPTRLTKRFEYHLVPNYISARAVIIKILYADGSTWVLEEKTK